VPVALTAVSKRQRYKFWKQFTTVVTFVAAKFVLFLNVKDTNFESNSQLNQLSLNAVEAVSKRQRYKFWKQFTTQYLLILCSLKLFLNVKDTNFESNSQRFRQSFLPKIAVSKRQRYKFWKQFTTKAIVIVLTFLLFLNVKDTNFESNSQLLRWLLTLWHSCF